MHFYLGLLVASFAITAGLMVPFIGILYRLKFTRKSETGEIRKDATKAFYKVRGMHAFKVGVPTGGGILVATVVTGLFAIIYLVGQSYGWKTILGSTGLVSGYQVGWELTVIFFTFISFGLLGFYDDLIKILGFKKNGFFGLRMRHKFIVQWILAAVIAGMLTWGLKIDFIYIPLVGLIRLGWLYFFPATFLIVAFANAFDITDGLDGLSGGLLLICLLAFWIISLTNLDGVLSVFIAVWIGALVAFLYFNIYPARIMLGNMGGLAFGATLAVIGLLSGKTIVLLLIGGVFLAEGLSSLLQLLSKRFMTKRIFPIAPFHHWLQLLGWEEPKIVARAWLVGLVLAIFGVWLAAL